MTGVSARAHPAGRRIDVRVALVRALPAIGDPERPQLRIVRQRLGFPGAPEDGVIVADLVDLFRTATQPRQRLERYRFRTLNTSDGDGMIEAEVTLYYDAPPPGAPVFTRLRFFDAALPGFVEEVVDEGSRLNRTLPLVAGWEYSEGLELFHTPGGGAEVSAGFLGVYYRNENPAIANMVQWFPAAGPNRTVEFDAFAHWKMDRTEATIITFETREGDLDPGTEWLTLDATRDPDAGTVTWSLEVHDAGLEPGVNYYYRVFDLATTTAVGQAVALATDDFDSPRRLFLRLPGVYQRADEPDPTRPTGAPGPLRRFLAPVGNMVDMARSIAASTRDLHDVQAARVDLLPRLARHIGWVPDITASAETQRRDILAAPEIFRSVGTIPNTRALVNRVSDWRCGVKEFVNNVFLTNAPESIKLWELWQTQYDGTTFTPPAPITLTTDIDAHPALALSGAGDLWLFFHSDRGGLRQIWRQRLGVDTAPARARAGASDDTPDFAARDQEPAAVWDGTNVRLFWSSDREGQWDIWTRTFDSAGNGGNPIRLTEHRADDRSPAAVFVPGPPALIRLFWSSNRRGPRDIWSRALDLATGTWGAEERLTASPLRDDRPAAAVDASGRVWLVWTRDYAGRQTLWYRRHDGTDWLEEIELDTDHARDDAATVVPWGTGIFLFWHSNHNGPWQIWGRLHDGSTPSAAKRLSPSVQGNKEPAAAVDSTGDVRVVWRSQRRARLFRSRTLDLDNALMLAEMGTYEDRSHYTYDTGEELEDWYSRGTVGLYLTPDTTDDDRIAAVAGRAMAFLEPFRPAPVRYTWATRGLTADESIDVGDLVGEAWSDDA